MKFTLSFRIAFFVFATIYLIMLVSFLTINLPNMPIQWDEAAHLNNGLFLKLGMYSNFQENLFYPPLYDFLTYLFFSLFGINLVSSRAIDALFSVLVLWIVFEFTSKAYDGKTALLATVFLSAMPGYFAASHVAMLDVPMVFFFIMSIFFFFLWLQKKDGKMIGFAAATLVVGFFVKYQIVVAALVIFLAAIILHRGRLNEYFKGKRILIIILLLIAMGFLLFIFRSYIVMWLNVIGMNTTGSQTIEPTFYLTQTQSIYPAIHPISILMYIMGFVGFGIFAIRREKSDKLFLIWFITILVFYTLLPNKNWRYVLPFYPVLAISAAVLIVLAFDKLRRSSKKNLAKIGAFLLLAFVCVSIVQSVNDNIAWINFERTPYELEQAVNYAIAHNSLNQSLLVICPNNLFSYGTVTFYLLRNGGAQMRLHSYPETTNIHPTFNIASLTSFCKQNNIKFLFVTEYLGEKISYLNMSLMDVIAQIYDSGNFTSIVPEQTFGQFPRRIFILNFTATS